MVSKNILGSENFIIGKIVKKSNKDLSMTSEFVFFCKSHLYTIWMIKLNQFALMMQKTLIKLSWIVIWHFLVGVKILMVGKMT